MKNNIDFFSLRDAISQLTGVSVSPGTAFGKALIIREALEEIPRYFIKKPEIERELSRLDQALNAVIDELTRAGEGLKQSVKESGGECDDIFDAQILQLNFSTTVLNIRTRVKDAALNAEAAVEDSFREATRKQRAANTPYLAERASDITALGAKIQRVLANNRSRLPERFSENTIVIANEFFPTEIAQLDRKYVKGLVTADCGTYSHAAIIARALKIPVLTCPEGFENLIRNGDNLFFNDQGVLYLNPSETTINKLRRNRPALKTSEPVNAECATADGQTVSVYANIELPEEMTEELSQKIKGIGLLRTEFLYTQSGYTPPNEELQYQVLCGIRNVLGDKPFIVRTLDIGGDKTPACLQNFIVKEANPALGIRGVRFSLKYPELFRTQIRAILRAAIKGDVRILLPMIGSAQEILSVKERIEAWRKELEAEKIPVPKKLPPIGVMIELPSAAICADILARESNFFAIGANDLTQYAFAADRNNRRVTEYFLAKDVAMLRLIELAVRAARDANIPVHICGEVSGDPEHIRNLLNIGVREISVSPPGVNAIKKIISEINLSVS